MYSCAWSVASKRVMRTFESATRPVAELRSGLGLHHHRSGKSVKQPSERRLRKPKQHSRETHWRYQSIRSTSFNLGRFSGSTVSIANSICATADERAEPSRRHGS